MGPLSQEVEKIAITKNKTLRISFEVFMQFVFSVIGDW